MEAHVKELFSMSRPHHAQTKISLHPSKRNVRDSIEYDPISHHILSLFPQLEQINVDVMFQSYHVCSM